MKNWISWNNIKARSPGAGRSSLCWPVSTTRRYSSTKISAARWLYAHNKLASSIMPAIAIREVVEEAYAADPGNDRLCRLRYIQAVPRDPAVDKYSTPLLYLKGFHAPGTPHRPLA